MIFINFFVILFSAGTVFASLNESCQTPSQDPGICVQLKNCSTLFALVENKSITDENKKLMTDSQCGRLSDGKPLFCCPQAVGIEITETPDVEATCLTPSNENGVCKVFKTCEPLFSIFERKPVSAENVKLIRESACGLSSNGRPLVCCPSHRNTTEIETVETFTILTEPTSSTFSTTVEPLPEEEPQWLKTLKTKLPQPPECGFSPEERIFGGDEADIDEFPWTVLLKYEYLKGRKQEGFFCGGSLINEVYVLTAAHCIKNDPNWKLVSVRTGDWKLSSNNDCDDYGICAPPAVDNKIAKMIVHTNYSKESNDQHFDIALLKLASKIKFNEFIMSICLPLDQKLLKRDHRKDTFDVAGWGKSKNAAGTDKKCKTSVPFVSKNLCAREYRRSRNVTETQICTGSFAGRDSCCGDSGGPLMHYLHDATHSYWYQVGIISHEKRDCKGVYTKTLSFLEWISDNIKN